MKCCFWVVSYSFCDLKEWGGVIVDLGSWWMMSLFRTIIAAGVGTCWISGSVCWKKGCVVDPWKQWGLVLCLLYFHWVEICGISSIFTTEIGFLEGINSLIPGIMILFASGNEFNLLASAYSVMKNVEKWDRLFPLECWGHTENVLPQTSSSVTVHPLQPAGDLFIPACSGCCTRTSVSVELHILSVRCFNKSVLLPFPTVDWPVCLLLHFQLLSDFSYSPELQCVHCHIVISYRTSIPNAAFILCSFLNSIAFLPDTAVIPLSTKSQVILWPGSCPPASQVTWCELKSQRVTLRALRRVPLVKTPLWVCVCDDSTAQHCFKSWWRKRTQGSMRGRKWWRV